MLQHHSSDSSPSRQFELPSTLQRKYLQQMAAVRENLKDTSEKLRVAFSDLRAIDEEVTALTAGAGDLPLSEAAANVSQGAGLAADVASRVLEAAKVAEAAAGIAAAAVTAAREKKAAASKAAAAAVAAAAAAEAEAVALEVKISPSIPLDHTYELVKLYLRGSNDILFS